VGEAAQPFTALSHCGAPQPQDVPRQKESTVAYPEGAEGLGRPGALTEGRNTLGFTNISHKKRNETAILYKTYRDNEWEYPKYDNYDAIDVSKTKNIPMDYVGTMGVPITVLDKYNPEQFEIVGLGNGREFFTPNKDYINPKQIMKDGTAKNGNAINRVLAIEVDKKPKGSTYYTSSNSGYLVAPYARILIKNKNPQRSPA